MITVAWTGIASILLPGGRTAHSVFKFPIPLTESSVSFVKPNTKAGQALKAAKAIIWDEASMVPGRALLCLDRLLRDIHQNETPFGGKIIILGGDFRQVLPVVPRSTRTGIVDNCLKRCSLWKFFKSFKLTINMRSQEPDYCNFLLRIGHGEGQDNASRIKIPDQILLKNGNLIDWVFQPNNGIIEIDNLKDRAILCPKNDQCAIINSSIVDMLPGQERTYLSADTIVSQDSQACFTRFTSISLN